MRLSIAFDYQKVTLCQTGELVTREDWWMSICPWFLSSYVFMSAFTQVGNVYQWGFPKQTCILKYTMAPRYTQIMSWNLCEGVLAGDYWMVPLWHRHRTPRSNREWNTIQSFTKYPCPSNPSKKLNFEILFRGNFVVGSKKVNRIVFSIQVCTDLCWQYFPHNSQISNF